MKTKIFLISLWFVFWMAPFFLIAQNKESAKKKSQPDTAGLGQGLNKVLDAFSKAANENPNDTSASNIAVKALTNLVGGGGISAADSAKAIESFRTAQGGAGYYYETTTTVTNKQTGNHISVSRSYFTNSGEGRSEMNIGAMMGAKNTKDLIVLAHSNHPRYSLILDEQERLYSLNLIDTDLINNNAANYKVTKLGTETISGFRCIHAMLNRASGRSSFSTSVTMEVWTSVEVPGYGLFKKTMTSQRVTPQMLRALEQAGCDGYVVKLNSNGKDFSMSYTLTLAEKRIIPASLLIIPASYKQSDDNLIFSSMTGAMRSGKK